MMIWEEVERIDFSAVDDADARAKAPNLQIPSFDDGDLTIVASDDGRVVSRSR